MKNLDIHGRMAGERILLLTARRDLPEAVIDKVKTLQP